jgi:hypothetical protein
MFNVYGIFCKTTWKVYYGSTALTLEKRLKSHEMDYKASLNGYYKYVSSYEIIKNNNYEIKLLETCDDEIHMKIREGYYIRTFPCVNKVIPGRTRKEYYEDNREEMKEYYKANKEKLTEKNKEYYKANKEKIAEKNKEYRETNKEKKEQKNKETYTCECGSISRKDGKARHEKSNKHKKYLENL